MAHELVWRGIGGRTVEELNETMLLTEFLRWAAFVNLEPRGDERRDWHVAMMLQQQADIHRDHKKSSRPPVHKFLPQFKHQRKKSISDFRELLRANHAALGGEPENSN